MSIFNEHDDEVAPSGAARPGEEKGVCRCDNEIHFAEGDPAGHAYGAKCSDLEPVHTHWGTFMLCKACRTDCVVPEMLL